MSSKITQYDAIRWEKKTYERRLNDENINKAVKARLTENNWENIRNTDDSNLAYDHDLTENISSRLDENNFAWAYLLILWSLSIQ